MNSLARSCVYIIVRFMCISTDQLLVYLLYLHPQLLSNTPISI